MSPRASIAVQVTCGACGRKGRGRMCGGTTTLPANWRIALASTYGFELPTCSDLCERRVRLRKGPYADEESDVS